MQAEAWPRIAAGDHVLVTAPTGSGKTLTAFLWALNQLLTGEYPTDRCSVLYVSPLKALNNDIQRNLLTPLAELGQVFEARGVPFPALRVLTRSGDTPPEGRRQMQRRPPEILITTPESLNLLLSSRGGVSLLGAVRTVILDEIHSVLASKRGTHLITAVERLVRLSGEFQRIALSATVRPRELAAQFVGGYLPLPGGGHRARPVSLVGGDGAKRYEVRVRYPLGIGEDAWEEPVWGPIVSQIKAIIRGNRSTLIFTNSRRLAETMTWRVNLSEEDLVAYAHHGALSREIRTEVERRLKAGELKAIVATNSLEMGIDIGSLDEVVLVEAPPTVASAIQRVGRAGHQVGEVSRATLFPTHSHDLLECAVMARNILAQNIEQAHAVRCPLDVLAQVLTSMTGMETWDLDELFAHVRCSYPFHDLSREQFDLVLQMLAGRYEETRIRGLKARVSLDRLDNTVAARPGALQELYQSGGTIPDRGYYHVRHLETNALIGELDEEFVWEAAPGQTMSFGTRNWRIERITHNDVFVVPVGGRGHDAPFWKGEAWGRDAHFSQLIALFLEEADERLEEPAFAAELRSDYQLDDQAAGELVDYLRRQRAAGGHLPHRHHLLVEHVAAGPDGYPGGQIVLHTCWGAPLNRPFALALTVAWQERFGHAPEVYPADDAVYLMMTESDPIAAEEILGLVTPERLEGLVRRSLEASGFFGARFREAAGRALLITRNRRGERMPLWVTRLQAKKLLDAVRRYEDFPMLLEAWRTCLQDEFDLEALRERLGELRAGVTTCTEVRRALPSPFAEVMTWQQINQYMYSDDTPGGAAVSQLRGDLLREVALTPALRPTVTAQVVAQFVSKRRRLAPGYSPQSPRDLLDWVKERLLLPEAEWRELLEAIQRDHGLTEADLLAGVPGKLVVLSPPGAGAGLVAATELLPRLRPLWGDGLTIRPLGSGAAPEEARLGREPPDELLTEVLGEWLRFYGPVSAAFVASALGLPAEALGPALEDLVDTQTVIRGRLVTEGGEDDLCDGENFEALLRLARAAAAPTVAPLALRDLALLVAAHQRLCAPGQTADDLYRCLELLSGYEARAEMWEQGILPARMCDYDGALLDGLMQEGHLHWVGAPRQRITFCLTEDLELLPAGPPRPVPEDLQELLPDPQARYTLRALLSRSGGGLGALTRRLWEGVWAGQVSNDTAAALRRGILSDYELLGPAEVAPPAPRARRRPLGAGRPRVAAPMPAAGAWYRLPAPQAPEGLLEKEERAKDRARILLDRYGILFRELLQRETAPFRWGAVFRALRLMELAGEVFGGSFVEGVSGLQFASPGTLRSLQRELPRETVWWVNACDPASLCGLGLEGVPGDLPRRLPGNAVVYCGADPVLVVLRGAQELRFAAPPDDPRLAEYLGPLHNLLERGFRPEHRLVVRLINGQPAARSPYAEALTAAFDALREVEELVLRRRRS